MHQENCNKNATLRKPENKDVLRFKDKDGEQQNQRKDWRLSELKGLGLVCEQGFIQRHERWFIKAQKQFSCWKLEKRIQ